MSSLLLEPVLSPWIMAESMVSSLTLVVAAVNMTGVEGVFFAAGTAASSVTTTEVDNGGVDGVFFDAGCCFC